MTGKLNRLASVCNGTCITFDGETKNPTAATGKQQKQGGDWENALNSNLAGKGVPGGSSVLFRPEMILCDMSVICCFCKGIPSNLLL